MARRHRELLAQLEPVGLKRYQITEKDVREVEKYIAIIQHDIGTPTIWEDLVRYAGSYGTSFLIHEVIEIRELRTRGFEPLRLRTQPLRKLLRQNIDAYVIPAKRVPIQRMFACGSMVRVVTCLSGSLATL
ncbi:MAG: hypothetical protein ACE5GO_09705 [Anaerolineales bacterium]